MGRTLLVASTGGHLVELERLWRRFRPKAGEVEWATFDDQQSRSLLDGHTVHYVAYIPPRGYAAVASAVRPAARLLRRGGFDRVISTGAAIAVPFLCAARALGLQAHYVESAARTSGPSLTGRVLRGLPGVRLYTQHPEWAGKRWRYGGSLFDGYQTYPAVPGEARRVVVTLGTMRGYAFGTAVARLAKVLPELLAPGAEVLWQVGAGEGADLGIRASSLLPATELAHAIEESDLVVAHAGIGSAITILNAGHTPVLLPRRLSRGEHIDDHQVLIAHHLAARGLAVEADAARVTAVELRLAMTRRVRRWESTQAFDLR
jgi:UDP-N-acetylglucosamine transferase subunit ALG13